MHKNRSRSGFTLIELLVVIALIVIVAGLIFVGGGGNDGRALESSTRLVSGIAKGARMQAIMNSSNARLIVHNDPNEPDKYRRLFGIIYADSDPDNNPSTPAPSPPTHWIAGNQGDLLPEGIYFDPDLSASVLGGAWGQQNLMQLEYPRSVSKAEGSGTEFFYYEFNSNGTMGNGFSNAVLVLRAGTLKPDGSGGFEIDFEEEAKELIKSALIFRRVGTSTIVNDPSVIE